MWKRLENYFKHDASKISAEKYFQICEQLGQEPDPEKIPPSWEDFPDIVRNAINIYNSLGDNIYPDVGFTGKDYTLLPHYIDVYFIDDKEYLLEILLFLDRMAIKTSSENLKKAHEKLKRKTSGRK
tara:strand:- start:4113 stop:4490 length:378 start_codon:yes stop_codon:yes gene_type:complete